MPLTRRDALRSAAAGLVAAPALFAVARAQEKKAAEFTLPPLPLYRFLVASGAT